MHLHISMTGRVAHLWGGGQLRALPYSLPDPGTNFALVCTQPTVTVLINMAVLTVVPRRKQH